MHLSISTVLYYYGLHQEQDGRRLGLCDSDDQSGRLSLTKGVGEGVDDLVIVSTVDLLRQGERDSAIALVNDAAAQMDVQAREGSLSVGQELVIQVQAGEAAEADSDAI